jgi:hypothetical protein
MTFLVRQYAAGYKTPRKKQGFMRGAAQAPYPALETLRHRLVQP